MTAMWVWGLGSGLAAAVIARGALPGAMVFVLAVAVFWVVLRPDRARRSAIEPSAGPPRPAPEMARAALMGADDLTRIKGLGPKLAVALREAGVHSFAQVAGWSPEQAAAMDAKVGARGRALRDDWVAQARALALGSDKAGDGPERT